MQFSKKPLGLALALIALMAWLLWNREDLFPEMAGAKKAGRDSSASGVDPGQESRRPSRSRPKLTKAIETDPETPAALHFRNFVIRSVHVEGEWGIPLAEAVSQVKAEYFKTAKETREESLSLTVDLSQADTSKTLSLKLPRGPVTSVLRLLAAASGNRLIGSGPDFRMEAFSDDGRKLTKTFSRKKGYYSEFETDAGLELNIQPFPIIGSCHAYVPPDPKNSAEKLGLQFSPDFVETRTFEANQETIQISNATAGDLELMEAALGLAESDAMAQQVKLSSKIIRMPADFEWPEVAQGTIDEGRFQSLMRELSQTQGTDLMTAPSLVARYGQISSVEIIQGAQDPSSPLWSGTQIRYAAQPLGTGTEDSFELIQSTPNAKRVSDEVPLPRVTVSGSSASNPESVQVTVTKDPDGANVIYIHRSQRIDATGRPIDSSGRPIISP